MVMDGGTCGGLCDSRWPRSPRYPSGSPARTDATQTDPDPRPLPGQDLGSATFNKVHETDGRTPIQRAGIPTNMVDVAENGTPAMEGLRDDVDIRSYLGLVSGKVIENITTGRVKL